MNKIANRYPTSSCPNQTFLEVKGTREILEIAPKIAHDPVQEIFSLDGVNILVVGEVFDINVAFKNYIMKGSSVNFSPVLCCDGPQ